MHVLRPAVAGKVMNLYLSNIRLHSTSGVMDLITLLTMLAVDFTAYLRSSFIQLFKKTFAFTMRHLIFEEVKLICLFIFRVCSNAVYF